MTQVWGRLGSGRDDIGEEGTLKLMNQLLVLDSIP